MRFLKPFILVLLVLGMMLFLIKFFMFWAFSNGKIDRKEDKETQILVANYDDGGEGVILELLNNQTFKVGDFGFALGIFGCFIVFGSVEFDAIFRAAPEAVGKHLPFLDEISFVHSDPRHFS